MRLKLIQKSCDAANSEIQFRVANTINQYILCIFSYKEVFCFFMELRACTEQLIKYFTSVYDLSSTIYIEIYKSQLPDMFLEFLNFENL